MARAFNQAQKFGGPKETASSLREVAALDPPDEWEQSA